MRIAIVEDIAEERKLLRSRLETQFEKRGIYAELVEFENGEDFLAAAKECSFPILFLDIYMSGENGVEVAKELREFDSDCLLIFTTTSVDHALDGFKVRAMQYLVKPYEEAELTKLIDEILSHIPDFGKYIEIKVDGSNVRVPYAKIVYAEHFSHMIHIHTTNGRELITRQSFESFTVLLKRDQRFYTCNRGVVINLEHAVDFDGVVFRLDDGITVSVSRKLIKNARQVFLTFYFRGGDDRVRYYSSNSGADGGDSRNDTCLFASKVLHETAIGQNC